MTDYDQFSSLDDLVKFVEFWFNCDAVVSNNPYTFHRELTCMWSDSWHNHEKPEIVRIAQQAGFITRHLNPFWGDSGSGLVIVCFD